jgi:hypothetical protein
MGGKVSGVGSTVGSRRDVGLRFTVAISGFGDEG